MQSLGVAMCAQLKPDQSAFPTEMLEVLRRACKSPKGRAAAIHDPRALLARHGIELGPDEEIRLYERVDTQKGNGGEPDPASPILSNALSGTPMGGILAAWYEEA